MAIKAEEYHLATIVAQLERFSVEVYPSISGAALPTARFSQFG